MDNVKLISGTSNLELAHKISCKLKLPLTECKFDRFDNSEHKIIIEENIRGYDIYIIQTGCKSLNSSVNDFFMELCLLIDTCNRSNSKSINVIIPCYPYARSDKKDDGRVPIGSKVITKILDGLGVNRIISMDLHSGQIQGFFDGPFDNLYDIKLQIKHLNDTYFRDLTNEEINDRYILISPDVGGIKRVQDYANRLKMNFASMHKQRDYTKKSTVINSMIVGDSSIHDLIKGKTAIIIDDIVDSMGTMESTAIELYNKGVKDIIIIATHGVFSKPAFERINRCDIIKTVIVTNSIPQQKNIVKSNKLRIVDISGLFSNVIKILSNGGSISQLFH
jgi:ribose-phosphate pyrophosphokinase